MENSVSLRARLELTGQGHTPVPDNSGFDMVVEYAEMGNTRHQELCKSLFGYTMLNSFPTILPDHYEKEHPKSKWDIITPIKSRSVRFSCLPFMEEYGT